jgi:hypothetical protein
MALIAGEAAELFEAEPVAATAARLMGVLRSIFIPQGIKVPDPVQVRRSCTRAPLPVCTCLKTAEQTRCRSPTRFTQA